MNKPLILLSLIITLAASIGTSPAHAQTRCWCQCEWVTPSQRRCRKVCRYVAPPAYAPQPRVAHPEPVRAAAYTPTSWQLPSIPSDLLGTILLLLGAVLAFAVIGHFSRIARTRRDIERITQQTMHTGHLRRRMDRVAHEADDLINAYRHEAFRRGREG